MITPYLQGQDLLANIRNTDIGADRFYLWWLGQSGFLIQWRGQHLLFDPYLSDSLTEKYALTDKPHIRMTSLAVDPAKLDFIDIVTSSHIHTDHLDAFSLKPLISANPGMSFIIPEANRAFVCERLGCRDDYPLGLNDKESLSVGDFTFHGVPAAHNLLEKNAKGQCLFMGYVVKFGPWTVYHSGDTLWYQDLEEILKPFQVDLALLPINGNKPERRVAGNLDYEEAPKLALAIGARTVIPCHYQMFEFNTADPQDFAVASKRLGQSYAVLECGEPWDSDQIGGAK